MAAPLYFFPGLRPQELRSGNRPCLTPFDSRGLAGIFRDVSDFQRQATLWEIAGAGPGGSSGTMFTTLVPGQSPPRLVYAPEFQVWTQAWLDPPLWIGVDREHPPTPEDLARPEQLSGYMLTLADGHRYVIPTIRRPDGADTLPHDFYRDASGTFQSQIKPAWREAWDRTGPLADLVFAGDGVGAGLAGMSEAEGLEHALYFLGLNYRYGDREQMALRLIDSDNWASVIGWACGLPLKMLEENRQKKDSSG